MRIYLLAALAVVVLAVGCAGKPRQLMPTPLLYQESAGTRLFEKPVGPRGSSTGVDLLYITDRSPETGRLQRDL